MMPMMRNNWIPTVFNDLFNTDFMPKVSATAPAINVKETDKLKFPTPDFMMF